MGVVLGPVYFTVDMHVFQPTVVATVICGVEKAGYGNAPRCQTVPVQVAERVMFTTVMDQGG